MTNEAGCLPVPTGWAHRIRAAPSLAPDCCPLQHQQEEPAATHCLPHKQLAVVARPQSHTFTHKTEEAVLSVHVLTPRPFRIINSFRALLSSSFLAHSSNAQCPSCLSLSTISRYPFHRPTEVALVAGSHVFPRQKRVYPSGSNREISLCKWSQWSQSPAEAEVAPHPERATALSA